MRQRQLVDLGKAIILIVAKGETGLPVEPPGQTQFANGNLVVVFLAVRKRIAIGEIVFDLGITHAKCQLQHFSQLRIDLEVNTLAVLLVARGGYARAEKVKRYFELVVDFVQINADDIRDCDAGVEDARQLGVDAVVFAVVEARFGTWEVTKTLANVGLGLTLRGVDAKAVVAKVMRVTDANHADVFVAIILGKTGIDLGRVVLELVFEQRAG